MNGVCSLALENFSDPYIVCRSGLVWLRMQFISPIGKIVSVGFQR